jgi:hypothetical protein
VVPVDVDWIALLSRSRTVVESRETLVLARDLASLRVDNLFRLRFETVKV